MNRILSAILLLTFVLGIGFSAWIYFAPLAHEKFSQPSVDSLLSEPKENLLKVDKEGLVQLFKTVVSFYDGFKNNSNERIKELRSALLVLMVLFSISIVFTISLLLKLRKCKQNKM
jgi:hypothetical protein